MTAPVGSLECTGSVLIVVKGTFLPVQGTVLRRATLFSCAALSRVMLRILAEMDAPAAGAALAYMEQQCRI